MTQEKKKRMRRYLILAVAGFLITALLSLGINFWVFQEIQKRLEVKIEGRYVPSVFIPSFRLEKGSFNWEDKVRLLEGTIKVRFDPTTLIFQKGIRIMVECSGAKIKLLGQWALQEGIEDATVDTLSADILLGRRGLAGINAIEAKSSKFQFSIKKADTKRQVKKSDQKTHA